MFCYTKLFILEPIICFIGKWLFKLKSVDGGDDGRRYITSWTKLSTASTDDWAVDWHMLENECNEKIKALKTDKQSYPTLIKAYLHGDKDKFVMIWETKKIASDVNTQWDAGCSLKESEYEKMITICDQKDYQPFHLHKHTNRFIRR